jgi:hypothetical protein
LLVLRAHATFEMEIIDHVYAPVLDLVERTDGLEQPVSLCARYCSCCVIITDRFRKFHLWQKVDCSWMGISN